MLTEQAKAFEAEVGTEEKITLSAGGVTVTLTGSPKSEDASGLIELAKMQPKPVKTTRKLDEKMMVQGGKASKSKNVKGEQAANIITTFFRK